MYQNWISLMKSPGSFFLCPSPALTRGKEPRVIYFSSWGGGAGGPADIIHILYIFWNKTSSENINIPQSIFQPQTNSEFQHVIFPLTEFTRNTLIKEPGTVQDNFEPSWSFKLIAGVSFCEGFVRGSWESFIQRCKRFLQRFKQNMEREEAKN